MSPLPLFITCQRKGCGQIKQVRDRRQQQRQKYCSPRCVGLMREFTREERQRGALSSTMVRRKATLARLDGMSPIAIYRQAFSNGWKAGVRSMRRRMGSAA